MSSTGEPAVLAGGISSDGLLRKDALLPALLIAALGVAVVLLRPPLPIDETRYLEVFRESLRGSPLLLRLSGQPYAEKPPLLFWLGQVLTLLGVSSWSALRLVPALSTALSVLFAARIGRRAGLAHVGWLQAALLVPALAGQFLLFDPLLCACIWGAVDAWTRSRDTAAWAWSSAALLAKGPVAFLFLIPFLWSSAPLRGGPRAVGRAALVLGLALLPLAAWALSAAALGGPEFANELLWKRWAGRVVSPGPATDTGPGPTNHPRPLWFYVPVALLGALPVTHFFARRGAAARPTWNRRFLGSIVFLLIAFTLISGKQAHYLVPIGPAVALLAAALLERGAERELGWLRLGVRVQLALVVAAIAVGAWKVPGATESFCPQGVAWLASGSWKLVLGAGALLALGGLLGAGRARTVPALCALAAGLGGAGLLGVHAVAGRLLFPHVLAATLAQSSTPIASFGGAQHGVYELLADADGLTKITDRDALVPWLEQHPDALLLSEENSFRGALPPELEPIARDVVHQALVLVLRLRKPAR